MLTFDDSESVMNAAGTMGTLVSEPSDGDFCHLLITFAKSLDLGPRSGQTKGLISGSKLFNTKILKGYFF